MLWPVVLPFTITVCTVALLVGAATAAAPLVRRRRMPTFLATSICGIVLFVPSCNLIMDVVDRQRFGTFEYASYSEVNDQRVERYLPSSAEAIILEKRAQGFRAKFEINENELAAFLDRLWNTYGTLSVVSRNEPDGGAKISSESISERFGDLGWPPLSDAVEYHSPVAANGAGFTVWYSPSQGVAYQQAGYW